MCCRPCEGERRAGDNRKIRRAATYIVSFGMRNTRARGCRPIVADTSFTGKVFISTPEDTGPDTDETFKAMPFTGKCQQHHFGAFCAPCRAA